MRNPLLLRILLIALVALFSGPRPSIAALGETVVICGADGAPRHVVFDFALGAPAAPDKVFERCDLCVACDAPATAFQFVPGAFQKAVVVALRPDDRIVLAALRTPRPAARAPPFIAFA